MTTISLDRGFIEWRDDAFSDPDFLLGGERVMAWYDVLARRRVILLAEAGSGKTEEMREQVRIHRCAGQFAIYATVEDVGRDGFERALGTPDRPRPAAPSTSR